MSLMPAAVPQGARWLMLGPARGGLAEIAEEFAVRRKHIGRVRWRQGVLIGLHGSVEGEEVGILAVGFAQNTRFFRVTLPVEDLRFAIGFGRQDRDLAVGARLDALGNLGALRPVFVGLALALLNHAAVDRLAVLRRQIRPAD